MKDYFSEKSALYKAYRPTYPVELLDFIYQQVIHFGKCWDCGTGNGQLATILSNRFVEVYATDISTEQLSQATPAHNIIYSKQPAEKTNFPPHHFDVITAGQSVHWFDIDAFYSEVRRTLKPNGVIAILGYGRLQIDRTIDPIINKFYCDTLGVFWDNARKYVDENYQTIPFPFKEIKCPSFSKKHLWTASQVIGYLETWSAVKQYTKKMKKNPIDLIKEDIIANWGESQKKEISFPLLTRIGIKNKPTIIESIL